MINTNKGKKPTTTDKSILAFLETGNSINHIKAIKLFGTSGLRDAIYRLRQDGNVINFKDIYYKKKSNKHYREYFLTDYVILDSGQKIQKSEKIVNPQCPKCQNERFGT